MCFSSILFKLTLEQFLANRISNTGRNLSSAFSAYIIVYYKTCMESKLKVDQFFVSNFLSFPDQEGVNFQIKTTQLGTELSKTASSACTGDTDKTDVFENCISLRNMVPPILTSITVFIELKAAEYVFLIFSPHLFVLAVTVDTIHPCADGIYKLRAPKSHVSLLLEVGLVVTPQHWGNPRLPPLRLQLLVLPRLPRYNWKR